MAKIVITTFGSAGDLNPFLALGLGLRARGHSVVFAVEENFRPSVANLGFEVCHQTGDGEKALEPYSKDMFGGSSPITSVRALINYYVVPTLRAKVAELMVACEGADLIIAPPQQQAASIVSELTGLAWATMSLTPSSIPSAYTAPQALPFYLPDSLQHIANRAMWGLGLKILAPMVDKPINQIRAEYGLPPRKHLMNNGNFSTALTALAVSPTLSPPQPDWPPYVKVTGFCFWDTPGEWQESAELKAFLDDTTRPTVVVSSGSMSLLVKDQFDKFFDTSLKAINLAGAKALVIGAAPGGLPAPLSEDIMSIPFAPFSQIYPRCATLIHHGGIGTLAQGLRAGVPALVVPWGADQFYNAAQIERIGAGAGLLRRSYTPSRAAKLLKDLIATKNSPKLKEIAASIAREDGVGQTCDAFEAAFQL